MSPLRLAYMPLLTYPDQTPDDSVEAGLALAKAFGSQLHATTFAARIPPVSGALGGRLINMSEMVRSIEEDSLVRCQHLKDLITDRSQSHLTVKCAVHTIEPGLIGGSAAYEARYFDLVLLVWRKESMVVRDFAEAVVFGAGRPTVLVPSGVTSAPIKHVAVAWDASRVAARALADVLPLLADNCKITVLTMHDEKLLPGKDLAEALASSLRTRGYDAEAENLSLGYGRISEIVQEAALNAGAQMLVMGGFGHSRLRDFVLGGATTGVFADVRLPILLSH